MERLKQIISESKNIVAFSGAGISTNSGLPDFRSADKGIGKTLDFPSLLSCKCLQESPGMFYENYRKYFIFDSAKPNDSHYALAKLERCGKLKAIVTQNVDGLHQKAGSKKVIELHGNQREYYCMECKREYTKDISSCKEIPRCDECKGVVRPNIVLYGEMLPQRDLHEAIEYISQSDLLLVCASSLTVHPACDLIFHTKGRIVIINNEPTPCDNFADLVINKDISDVLNEVVQL